MDANALTVWSDVIVILKQQLSEITFKTWIETVEPVSFCDGILTLKTPSEFNTSVLQARYYDLIKQALHQATSTDANVHCISTVKLFPRHMAKGHGLQELSPPPPCINPGFTFDSFAEGACNRVALWAAKQAALRTLKGNNPLYIFGNIGMGKTHLLHAIGNEIMRTAPSTKVILVSVDQFVNEMVGFIKDDVPDGLLRKYGQADVLLIDNIQFLYGKERTQEEFFRVFNTLLHDGKQIVMTSTNSLRDLSILGNRFSSAFDVGLAVNLEPYDFDSRVSLLEKLCATQEMSVPNDVIRYIARQVKENPREIRLALNTVWAYACQYKGRKLDRSLAREALRVILPVIR